MCYGKVDDRDSDLRKVLWKLGRWWWCCGAVFGSFSSNSWISFEGISTSNLSDGILVIHVPEDNKQKVENGNVATVSLWLEGLVADNLNIFLWNTGITQLLMFTNSVIS